MWHANSKIASGAIRAKASIVVLVVYIANDLRSHMWREKNRKYKEFATQGLVMKT